MRTSYAYLNCFPASFPWLAMQSFVCATQVFAHYHFYLAVASTVVITALPYRSLTPILRRYFARPGCPAPAVALISLLSRPCSGSVRPICPVPAVVERPTCRACGSVRSSEAGAPPLCCRPPVSVRLLPPELPVARRPQSTQGRPQGRDRLCRLRQGLQQQVQPVRAHVGQAQAAGRAG